MNKSRNSYYDIAERDYLSAKSLLNSENSEYFYNNVACLSSQAAEKYMKAVLNEYDMDSPRIMELMRTHNQQLLLNRIKEIFTFCDMCVDDYKSLGDYYLEIGYPGENFKEIDKESAEKCIKLVDKLKKFNDTMNEIELKKNL